MCLSNQEKTMLEQEKDQEFAKFIFNVTFIVTCIGLFIVWLCGGMVL